MISKLHYITQDIPGFSHQQLTELACKGGVNWVQLRLKNKSQEEWLLIAQETKLICLKYGAQLIINDSIEIAKTVGAAGVHLGKEDVSPAEAREILGNKIIIGGSCNTIEDVERNIQAGCDYVGIGPYRFTSTKDKLNPILGLEGIREIAKKYGDKIPMIAIGGIKLEDVKPLFQTGIYGVAISSAINISEDRSMAAKKILVKIHKCISL